MIIRLLLINPIISCHSHYHTKKNKNVKMSRCQDCKAVTPLGDRQVVNESQRITVRLRSAKYPATSSASATTADMQIYF